MVRPGLLLVSTVPRRRSVRAAALVVASLLCAATHARAQRAFDLSRFSPALDPDSFIGVQGTRTPGPSRVTLGLFLDYAHDLLTVQSGTRSDIDLVQHRFEGVLSAEAGLGGRTALALSMPLVLYQHGERLASSEPRLPSFATGDPLLQLRYRLLGEPSTADATQRRDGPGVALQLGAALPAGDADAWLGEGAVRAQAQLLADLHLLGAGIGASLGVRHRFESARVFDVRVRDEMTFGAGIEMPIPPLFPLSALVEFRGATAFKSATTALEGEVGARLRLHSGFVFTLAGGAGLSGAVGTPDVRVIAGLWYTPSESDMDHDGIPDDADECPPLPEDYDGFQDEDGCPDPDNDNDLVPDIDDLCPNQAAEEGHDENEDGCTDR